MNAGIVEEVKLIVLYKVARRVTTHTQTNTSQNTFFITCTARLLPTSAAIANSPFPSLTMTTTLQWDGNLTYSWEMSYSRPPTITLSHQISHGCIHLPAASVTKWSTACLIQRAKVHHHAKFCRNRLNGCWYITLFRFFKMAANRHLGFSNSINLNGRRVVEVPDTSSCQIWSKYVKQLRRYRN